VLCLLFFYHLPNLLTFTANYLVRNNLSGTIPTELGFLTNIEMIHLRANNFTGRVPSELFAIQNISSGTEFWEKGIRVSGNPDLYALCDEYFDPGKIDIPCDDGAPSAAPSKSSSPTSSSEPSTAPSTPPSSNPTSSSVPTLPHDCSCDVGEFKVEVELKTDEWPGETSWKIQDENGYILAEDPEYNEQFKIFTHDYCLPVGCYDFNITDSAWDGICCSEGDGYYKGIVYGRKKVFEGGRFEFQAIENFCGEDVCSL